MGCDVLEDVWVVIHCEADDSHNLVDEDDIVFQEKIVVGDRVRFHCAGYTDLLEGTVKGLSSNKPKMIRLMDNLNKTTKPRRVQSFDPTLPRKAAQKCKQVLAGKSTDSKGRRSSVESSNSIEPPSSAPSDSGNASTRQSSTRVVSGNASHRSPSADSENGCQSLLSAHSGNAGVRLSAGSNNTTLPSDFDSDDEVRDKDFSVPDADSDESSSNDELTEEEQQLLNKLSKRKRSLDLKELQRFQWRRTDHDSNPKKRVKPDPNRGKPDPNLERRGKPDPNPERQGKPDPPPEKQLDVLYQQIICTPSRKHIAPRATRIIKFEGQQLQCDSTDENVVKLRDDINIYISERDLKKAKRNYSTATALARGLVRMIFTAEARQHCSVSGKASMVKGQETPEIRTPLDQDGVDAILEFVTERATKKGWKGTSNACIKQAMANSLCEERSKVCHTLES